MDSVHTIYMEVIRVETQEALQKAYEAGTPIAFIAKNIGKDPSTLNKWLRGSSKYLRKETEEDLIDELRRIKELWNNIEI